MKTIYILDDIFWEKLYLELVQYFPDYNFVIKNNILDPLIYLNDILNNNPDYILLDHWFKTDESELPLWYKFLKTLDEKLKYTEEIEIKKYFFIKKKKIIEKYKDFKSKIISISDEGEKLRSRELYEKYIKFYIPTKKWEDIKNYIQ